MPKQPKQYSFFKDLFPVNLLTSYRWTIDNYVLNNAFKWYGIRPLPIAWSKLNDYDLYINYQMDLKLVADNKGITQLELDFELWQRNGEVILK